MQFLNPWMLWGTLGVAIPIVIHLLNRYRYRQIDWGAMELLRRAMIVRARRLHLEDWILLALRCFAVLLIALALARPTITPGHASWLGNENQVGAVIAVDVSASMDHRPDLRPEAESRLDRAKARVRTILKSMKPGNPVTLVLMGQKPRVVLGNVGYQEERVEDALRSVTPLPERLNLEVCLEEIDTRLREIKAPVRECYLITDAQASTWSRLSPQAQATLKRISEVGPIFYLPVGTDGAENLALTRFELETGTLRLGSLARYRATLENTGARLRENIPVTLYIDGKSVEQRVIRTLAPGRSSDVPFYVRFDRVGTARLRVRLGQDEPGAEAAKESVRYDELTADNTRYAVASVREKVRVLLVDGNPSVEPFKGETDYLRTALLPKPSEAARQALEVKVVSRHEPFTKLLSEFDVLVLANVPDLEEAQVRALFQFVEQGGGLFVFLGDQSDPEVVNARFQHDGIPLLPGELQKPVGEVSERAEGWSVEVANPDHPLGRVVARFPAELVREARVLRYLPLRLGEGAGAILKLSGTNGDILLAEKRLGRGRVLLCTSTADVDWNNLFHSTGIIGPPLLHQAVTYFGRQAFEQPVTVGEPLVLSLPIAADAFDGQNAIFSFGKDQNATVQLVRREGLTLAELPQTEQPGFHEVRYGKDSPSLVAAVNLDPRESKVKSLGGDDLATEFAGLKLRVVEEGDDLARAIEESRVGFELSWWLLLLALLVLALELFLGYWFTQSAQARKSLGGISVQRASRRRALVGAS